MQDAIAFCHHDVVVAAWSCRRKFRGWMGFTVCRVDVLSRQPVP
jgi:hypothetical protein